MESDISPPIPDPEDLQVAVGTESDWLADKKLSRSAYVDARRRGFSMLGWAVFLLVLVLLPGSCPGGRGVREAFQRLRVAG